MKQVGVAFRVWPTDGDQFPTGVGVKFGGAKEEIEKGHFAFNFLVMSNELSTPKILVCPDDGRKTAATNFGIAFNDRNVSYFVGVDATEYFPQMFLSGDPNLAFEKKPLQPGIFVCTTNQSALSWTETIHNRCGNIGLADGSVQRFDSHNLVVAAAQQECNNRFAIP